MFLSEGGYCLPKCGDNLRLGKEECDDGNRINGDGCDQICREEAGYDCSSGVCRELFQPYQTDSSASNYNTISFSLNENVFISQPDLFHSTAFFNSSITGPSKTYDYEWEFVRTDLMREKGLNGTLKMITARVHSVQNNLMGDNREEFTLILNDTSLIQDHSNNSFKNPLSVKLSRVAVQNSGATSFSKQAGQAVMIGYLTSMGVQIVLKLIISQAAGYLWEVTHIV